MYKKESIVINDINFYCLFFFFNHDIFINGKISYQAVALYCKEDYYYYYYFISCKKTIVIRAIRRRHAELNNVTLHYISRKEKLNPSVESFHRRTVSFFLNLYLFEINSSRSFDLHRIKKLLQQIGCEYSVAMLFNF